MTKRKTNKIKKFSPLFIAISILFMSVGYAVINSISLNLDGVAHSKTYTGVYISEIELINNTEADTINSKINNVYQTMIDSKIVLSNTNNSSSITYQITLYNNSTNNSYYLGTSYDENYYDNLDITYEIIGIQEGEFIEPNSYHTITIIYYYNNNVLSPTSNILNSYINIDFAEYGLLFYKTGTQLVSPSNPNIQLVVSNSSDYDITGVIKYNETILSDSITIKANEEYKIISVDTTSILSTIQTSTLNPVSFQVTNPYSYVDTEIAVFNKETASISISKINTYIDGILQTNSTSIYNSENILLVENQPNNSQYSYEVTVKSNSATDIYKLRNITELLNNKTLTYETNIDLSDGILINPQKEYTFTINYNYNNLSEKHVQMLYLDFRWNYKFEAIEAQLISLSTPETNSESKFGDFSSVTSSTTLSANYCTYNSCYSDNNGQLVYDEEGGLLLDSNNAIATLDIDQSMSIADEYTLYMTVKADTNQEGVPSLSFPGTILAVSESNQKYLIWIGFFKNYIQVYSYYNGSAQGNVVTNKTLTGFISKEISEYSNQKINIMVTGVRGGTTSIYINGTLFTTFDSGTNQVDYKSATIGDLRPGRGLKYTGTIYDLAMYNIALTEEEIQTNWEYANARWQITN